MNIHKLNLNCLLVSLNDGKQFLLSYETVVAGFIPSQGYIKTDRMFSQTTSKHINAYIDKQPVTIVKHDWLVNLFSSS